MLESQNITDIELQIKKYPNFLKENGKPKAVSLLSGGLDSSMATFLLKEDFEIYPLMIDYKQKSFKPELACVVNQIELYDYKELVIFESSIYKTLQMGLSSDHDDIDDKDAFTPARNIFFAVPAMIYAKYIGAKYVIRGTIQNDQSNKIIRDNNEIFWNKVTDISNYCVNDSIQFISPISSLSKRDVIVLGLDKKFDFSLTWSCFNAVVESGKVHEDYKPCGVCANCVERNYSFEVIGESDPAKSIRYKKETNFKYL